MSIARRWPRTALSIAGWLLALLSAVAPRAEEPPPAEPEKPQEEAAPAPAGTAAETGTVEEALTPEERRAKAKAARIEEYLRKRDARRKEVEERHATSAAEEREAEAQEIERQLATSQAATEEPAGASPAPAAVLPLPAAGKAPKVRRSSGLPRGLAKAQANVRATELGADPTVSEYLALIDEQGASPRQLAAFGNFIAENGLIRDALEYYEVAVRLEPNDPVLWINAGTLQIQAGNLSDAAKAFNQALRLNPNSAIAHYNLGTVLDSMDHYEDALLEYRAALTIDPSLGDPVHNPQAANNDHLTAVKLMLHQERAGSLSMGLIDVPTGEEAPEAGTRPD